MRADEVDDFLMCMSRDEVWFDCRGHKYAVYTETDPEYDYLESEFDFVVEIANSNKGGESLELVFADEFTIFFGGTHVHYETNVSEYEGCFLKKVTQILEGKVSAVSAWVGDQWIASAFTGRMLSPDVGWEKGLALFKHLPAEFVQRLKSPDSLIKVVNWLPHKSFQVRPPRIEARPVRNWQIFKCDCFQRFVHGLQIPNSSQR